MKRESIRFSPLTAILWLVVATVSIILLWQLITRLSTRSLPVNTPTPNLTQVYQTIAAMLTPQQTTPATPSAPSGTPSPTTGSTLLPPSAVPSQNAIPTPSAAAQSPTLIVVCDQAAAGNPIDITIPDDSLMQPGQDFIKTWKLVNIGACTWTSAYSASFFYGDRMDAPDSVPLDENVLPGASIEISIEMVAPLAPGTYQGNWKLSNADGVLFGIGPNGDSPFWVRIIVAENLIDTPTATIGPLPTFTSTASPSPTSTATPPVQAGGELSPVPGDLIDLDTLTLNSGDEDLAYQTDANNYHWLAPQLGAMIGVSGSLEPSLPECQVAGMSPAPIAVESLSTGTYLCYLTSQGRFGRALLVSLDPDDFTLTLELLTWASP